MLLPRRFQTANPGRIMMHTVSKRLVLALLGAVSAAFLTSVGITLAFEGQGVAVTLPQNIRFKSPLVGVPGVATLFGDPTKPELFVQQVKFPAGFKLMPHWHPEAVRTVVVLSGTLYYANGEQWDESKLEPFPAGTFFAEPQRVPHYAWAKDGEVLLQLTAIGPTGTTFIEQATK
jgi:quercetin dioxygenase-like cupin family protein